ncbi:unnamed protein product, partial [Prunus brigantina]
MGTSLAGSKFYSKWSEKLPDGTRACLHNFIHRPLKEMTIEGIYLGKCCDMDEPSPDQHEQVLDDDSEPEDDYPDPYDDETDPVDGWFDDDQRVNYELLSSSQSHPKIKDHLESLGNRAVVLEPRTRKEQDRELVMTMKLWTRLLLTAPSVTKAPACHHSIVQQLLRVISSSS